MKKIVFLIILIFNLIYNSVFSQLSGLNIFEYQLGNLPGYQPGDMSVHYNQLNLQYTQGSIKAGIRFEHFLTPFDKKNYYDLSQYYLQYKKDNIEIKVGSFYELLGRGLLLRAYEIPGSIYEDKVYRVQYGLQKDLNGVLLKYETNNFQIKALRAKPLNNQLPPTLPEKEKRVDLVEAIETDYSFANQTIGGRYLRNNIEDSTENYISVSLEGSFASGLSYYGEMAQMTGKNNPLIKYSGKSRFGAYLSLNYSINNLGFSLEYKNYQKFILGSGFNDPPALVMEHSFKTLKRSIHVPQAIKENGLQSQIYYRFTNDHQLSFNYAFANYGKEYHEFYTEYTSPFGKSSNLKTFADYSKDPFKGENNRYATGFTFEHVFKNRIGLTFDIEYQFFKRKILEEVNIYNTVMGLTISKGPDISGGITWEKSNDLLVKEKPENMNTDWLGFVINYKPNSAHNINLFFGKRRGGPACSSGVCYEVLDFKGIELKLTSKF